MSAKQEGAGFACKVKEGYLLLEGGHARHKQHGCELDGALHVEVGVCKRLQELLKGLLEEGVVLIIGHLWLHGRMYVHNCTEWTVLCGLLTVPRHQGD